MRLTALCVLLAWACDDGASAPAIPMSDLSVDAAAELDMANRPDVPVGPRLIHVGMSTDMRPADGSRERPYPTARDAFSVAEPGDVVFLLDGAHAAIEAVPPGVELLGAGPESTRLAGPLTIEFADAVVGGFTLIGGALEVRASATVSDVVIESAPTPALVIAAPTGLVEVRVVDPEGIEAAAQIDAALSWEGGGVAGSPGAALVSEGADLTLVDLDLDDCGGFGIYAEGGRHLVRGLRVRGAAGAAARFLRAETEVVDCGIANVATADNVGSGVGFIDGVGTVTGCEIVDAERGLRVTLGGRMTARDVRVSRVRGDGVTINGEASGEVEDLTVTDARNGGVTVVRATATLRRVAVTDGRRHGLLVSESTATIEDIDIGGGEARGIALLRSTATVTTGHVRDAADVCIQITDPAGANVVTGVGLERCAGAGIGVFGEGTGTVEVRGTTVAGVTPGPDDFAAGVHVFGGVVTLSEVTIRDGRGEGIRFENGAGRLDAVTVEDHTGPGLAVLDPSGPVVADGLIARRNGGAGVLVTGGLVELGAPQISATVAAAGIGPGDGVAAPFQAEVAIRGGVIDANANHGVWIDGFSTGRLVESVALSDNGGYGLLVGCGSILEIPFSYDARDNGRGDDSVCR